MNQSPGPVVQLTDIAFSYQGEDLLQDVNLTVHPGDFLGLIGPNGSGKTTLLRILLGLLKPDRGVVTVLGKPPLAARREIGYVPQNVNVDRTFPVRVIDVVLMGRLAHTRPIGPYRQGDYQAAHDALDKVGMDTIAGQHFATLSGGQRQRVLVARALAGQPRLLVLDEPTASADCRAEESLYNLFKQLNLDTTIILVTHDIGVISSYVNRIACLNHQITMHAPTAITEDVLESMYHRAVSKVDHSHHHGGQQP